MKFSTPTVRQKWLTLRLSPLRKVLNSTQMTSPALRLPRLPTWPSLPWVYSCNIWSVSATIHRDSTSQFDLRGVPGRMHEQKFQHWFLPTNLISSSNMIMNSAPHYISLFSLLSKNSEPDKLTKLWSSALLRNSSMKFRHDVILNLNFQIPTLFFTFSFQPRPEPYYPILLHVFHSKNYVFDFSLPDIL